MSAIRSDPRTVLTSSSKPALVREVFARLNPPFESEPWVIITNTSDVSRWATSIERSNLRLRIINTGQSTSDMYNSTGLWHGPWQPRLPEPVVVVDWSVFRELPSQQIMIGALILDVPTEEVISALELVSGWTQSALLILTNSVRAAVTFGGLTGAAVVDLDREQVLPLDFRKRLSIVPVAWEEDLDPVLQLLDQVDEPLRALLRREARCSMVALWEAVQIAAAEGRIPPAIFEDLDEQLSLCLENDKWKPLFAALDTEGITMTVRTARLATALDVATLLGDLEMPYARAEANTWKVDLPGYSLAQVFIIDDSATPDVIPASTVVIHLDVPDTWRAFVCRVRADDAAHPGARHTILMRPGDDLVKLEAQARGGGRGRAI